MCFGSEGRGLLGFVTVLAWVVLNQQSARGFIWRCFELQKTATPRLLLGHSVRG